MKTPEQELAKQVYLRDGRWGMTGCLQEAKNEVALHGHDDLDDLDQIHVRILAYLCSSGLSRASTIAIVMGLDEITVNEHLGVLRDVLYAEECFDGYQTSEVGKAIVFKVGIEMLGMDRFRMMGELESSERLLKKLVQR